MPRPGKLSIAVAMDTGQDFTDEAAAYKEAIRSVNRTNETIPTERGGICRLKTTIPVLFECYVWCCKRLRSVGVELHDANGRNSGLTADLRSRLLIMKPVQQLQ